MPTYAAFLRGISPLNAKMSELRKCFEAAMEKDLGRVFATTVRSIDELAALVASDPYKAFKLAPNCKRVVTLLHAKPKARVKLPIELDEARILCVKGSEIYSAYVPSA